MYINRPHGQRAGGLFAAHSRAGFCLKWHIAAIFMQNAPKTRPKK